MHLSRVEVKGYRASVGSPLTCELSGRFSALLGSNGSGKTTLSEAILHAHIQRFPRPPAFDAALLGPPPRAVRVEYEYETDAEGEGALGKALRSSGYVAPTWGRPLERSLGKIRAGAVAEITGRPENIRLIYLPALRNPVDELSRRDAQVLLELLRAEQLRNPSSGGLRGLRAQAQTMLSSMTAHQLISDLEGRIAEQLKTLSGGLREHHAFIGTQRVDDAYLARVLELLLATLPVRGEARRLEASSLGYVNLLHIAVTLAGIPNPSSDPVAGAQPTDDEDAPPSGASQATEDDAGTRDARQRLNEVSEAAEEDHDSFFPELFHATVLIEEPEAHLHPQLQYGLVRYLRRMVTLRRDLQVIVTTHSGEIAAATDPSELVVVRRTQSGSSVSRQLNKLPLAPAKRQDLFQQTRLHLDASRSSALFGDRVLVVEGVTEAALLRVLGRAWAGGDDRKTAFVDALPLVPVGHKVGEWPIRILATPGFELVGRVAALADTDQRGDPLPDPAPPAWHAELDNETARFFWSQPTLEPSLVHGNEEAVSDALGRISLTVPASVTPLAVDSLFTDGNRRKKGAFAMALAAVFEDDLAGTTVPDHIAALFDWLYEPTTPGQDPQAQTPLAST